MVRDLIKVIVSTLAALMICSSGYAQIATYSGGDDSTDSCPDVKSINTFAVSWESSGLNPLHPTAVMAVSDAIGKCEAGLSSKKSTVDANMISAMETCSAKPKCGLNSGGKTDKPCKTVEVHYADDEQECLYNVDLGAKITVYTDDDTGEVTHVQLDNGICSSSSNDETGYHAAAEGSYGFPRKECNKFDVAMH